MCYTRGWDAKLILYIIVYIIDTQVGIVPNIIIYYYIWAHCYNIPFEPTMLKHKIKRRYGYAPAIIAPAPAASNPFLITFFVAVCPISFMACFPACPTCFTTFFAAWPILCPIFRSLCFKWKCPPTIYIYSKKNQNQ